LGEGARFVFETSAFLTVVPTFGTTFGTTLGMATLRLDVETLLVFVPDKCPFSGEEDLRLASIRVLCHVKLCVIYKAKAVTHTIGSHNTHEW
jgi:hypothetical protein